MPTIGWLRRMAPVEPKYPRWPKVKIPPSEATSQYPAGAMVKPDEIADGRPGAVATRLYPEPTLAIEQLKRATPPEVVTGSWVQARVAPVGLLWSVRVTWVLPAVRLPKRSSTPTVVAKLDPGPVTAGGCVVKASLTGLLGLITKLDDTAVAKLGALA